MTRKESEKLDELNDLYQELTRREEAQGKKIDKVLESLTGDELGSYGGLIADQKRDNAFRSSVSVQLDTIAKNQKAQFEINETYHERLTSLENFANFFTTLGKVKRTAWIIIGALATGVGYVMLKVQGVLKWLTSWLDLPSGS